jgi:drug/metabolite transporter (DMT)-like permease
MDTAYLFAVGAALSWTLASLFGHGPARQLGSVHFNRLRMLAATILLCIMMVVTGASWALPVQFILPILLSSVIGVVLGDYFLFVSMRRLGPRRTGVLFAANAPIAACLGWLILDEAVSGATILAVLSGFIGICLAVIYGKRRDLLHIWEEITPPLWMGVGAGILAAVGQAAGVLFLRPVMEAGMDPLMVSLVRVAIGAAIFWASLPFDPARAHTMLIPERRTGLMIIANGFFGLSFGVACYRH